MGDRRQHDDAEQHRGRRHPQQLVAERGAGSERGDRGATTERHGALHVARAAELQEGPGAPKWGRAVEFGEKLLLRVERFGIGWVRHA